jgi:hypothetical protein
MCSAINIDAQQDYNLNEHVFYPMGEAARIFLVPRWDPSSGNVNCGYWFPHARHNNEELVIHLVPAFAHRFGANEWKAPPEHTTATLKKTDVPHGQLHKAYLCISQLDLQITPVFDIHAINDAFVKLKTKAHLEAPDLIARMKEEFLGYALRRNAPGLEKMKVRHLVFALAVNNFSYDYI